VQAAGVLMPSNKITTTFANLDSCLDFVMVQIFDRIGEHRSSPSLFSRTRSPEWNWSLVFIDHPNTLSRAMRHTKTSMAVPMKVIVP
jgi:hypothetical protein